MRDITEKSIRNISVHKRRAAVHARDYEVETPRRRSRRPRHYWLIAVVVVLVCVAAGFLLSVIFAGATVTIHPRTQTVTLPSTLQAQVNAPVGVLAYQKISVTRSASQSVPATGTAHVSRAASGLVTITNTYSAAVQRLIANTRFAAADGKIYRIHDSVIVPGMTAGKPGTVTATIYADSPGPTYNRTDVTTFTIPGFKGDPRYTKFTAQSTGAISGGFIGDEPAVAPADLSAAKQALQKSVEADVRSAATSQIPAGYVALPGTLQISFADITQTKGENNTANLTQAATATGDIVRQSDLAAAIAHKTVQDYHGESVLFGAGSNMTVGVASSTLQSDTLTINLTGSATLVWQFDQNAIAQALVGKNKSEFETVIKSFQPAVAKADASIRPFWQGKFPDTVDKIKIKVAQ